MMTSRLKLNRFLVFHQNNIIYDELFHDGINVIRGEHSVGKSTLFDLIYYVLGGELKDSEWKYPTDRCTEVRAEVSINNRPITLARDIVVGGNPKIRIYDDIYEKAAKDSENWLIFGARRTDKKASFSEIIFDYFGWGQQKTSAFNNLTMHQILRLCYLSQSSKTTNIFREEIDKRGDSNSTRKAIAEFLLGLDDLTSYDKRQQKLLKDSTLSRLEAKRDATLRTLEGAGVTTIDDINDLIGETEKSIASLQSERREKLNSIEPVEDEPSAVSNRRINLFDNIKEMSKVLGAVSNKMLLLHQEISDCELFAKSLEFRAKSLGESRETYKALGSVSFNYCPSCFSQIDDEKTGDHKCRLCQQEIPDNELSEKYTETLTELKYQERQNESSIEILREELHNNIINYANIEERLSEYQNELERTNVVSNERELTISEYTNKISNLQSDIKNFKKNIPVIIELESLKERISFIAGEIRTLETEIKDLIFKNEKRSTLVHESLKTITTEFLENGTGNEHDFKDATERDVEIDFEKDRWLLGGRVSFSESSNAEKRSALHIAFLLQALNDQGSRYPLFSIMDFECADLNENRSQKIQTNILELLKGKSGFQLLITSSKIADELNNEDLGVGRFYSDNDYIFQI